MRALPVVCAVRRADPGIPGHSRSYTEHMYARRRRRYFLLMGGCLVLFVSAWTFVRDWSVPAAVGLCLVAMLIPPMAAIVGNTKDRTDHWWDDPPEGEPSESEKWLDELDHRTRHGKHHERSEEQRVAEQGREMERGQGGRPAGKPPPGARSPGSRRR
ncbi:DUF3099 domain-containing protein [Streptomyces sp. NPDC092295]|uniref:DUF3099 domain-containing protein n=1 Tax=Streptomyces sp. NPDC092295 TaxID=3366011 RepID=UPI00381198E8